MVVTAVVALVDFFNRWLGEGPDLGERSVHLLGMVKGKDGKSSSAKKPRKRYSNHVRRNNTRNYSVKYRKSKKKANLVFPLYPEMVLDVAMKQCTESSVGMKGEYSYCGYDKSGLRETIFDSLCGKNENIDISASF